MSSGFSCNQYDDTFNAKRLLNYTQPKTPKRPYPRRRIGFTQVIANNRGHLLEGVPKSVEQPWFDYMNRLVLAKIPSNTWNIETGRSKKGVEKEKKIKATFNLREKFAAVRPTAIYPRYSLLTNEHKYRQVKEAREYVPHIGIPPPPKPTYSNRDKRSRWNAHITYPSFSIFSKKDPIYKIV